MKLYLHEMNGDICVYNENYTKYCRPYFVHAMKNHSTNMTDDVLHAAVRKYKLKWKPVPRASYFVGIPMSTVILDV